MTEKELIFDKDFLKRGRGGYVFLSHSHEDIKDVRVIRNTFEEKGFEPLCFFLKCLDNDYNERLLKELIKSEIDARDFFVYIESKNAEKSKWVKYERTCVKELSKNQNSIFRINLDEFKNSPQCDVKLEAEIEKIVRTRRIFLAYSNEDRDIAYKIASALQERDFNVWTDQEISLGSDWYDEIAGALKEAAEYGCVIPIISEHSVKENSFVRDEIIFAKSCGAKIFPVHVGEKHVLPPISIITLQSFFINDPQSDEQINKFVDYIEDNLHFE